TMYRCLPFGLALGVALALGAGPARAGLLFSFHFDQSNYDVQPNQGVDVEVFLRQLGTPGAGEVNVLGGAGAVGMTDTGVGLTFPTGPDDAQVLSADAITGNAAFDNFGFGAFTSVSGGKALLAQSTGAAP